MLHHWVASQKGFSIRWHQVFRTSLNSKKTSFKKKAMKLKSPNVGEKYNFKKKLANIIFP